MIKNCIIRIWEFYRDGFREMTLGRTLWMLILVKLFIMFFIKTVSFEFGSFIGMDFGK